MPISYTNKGTINSRSCDSKTRKYVKKNVQFVLNVVFANIGFTSTNMLV